MTRSRDNNFQRLKLRACCQPYEDRTVVRRPEGLGYLRMLTPQEGWMEFEDAYCPVDPNKVFVLSPLSAIIEVDFGSLERKRPANPS